MRRWLTVLLLVLLPLQSVWAAAGIYCQHESGADANHFGHHDHQHQADADAAHSHDGTQPDGADLDCGVCHLGGSAAVLTTFHLPEVIVAAPADSVDRPHRLTAPPPTRHERPKWAGLA